MSRSIGWATLGRPARAYRVFHAAWSVAGLASLGYIWACAAKRRRDRWLWASIAFLSIEGAGLVVGGGDCPMGPLQARIGDPVPFFELVPPRAARQQYRFSREHRSPGSWRSRFGGRPADSTVAQPRSRPCRPGRRSLRHTFCNGTSKRFRANRRSPACRGAPTCLTSRSSNGSTSSPARRSTYGSVPPPAAVSGRPTRSGSRPSRSSSTSATTCSISARPALGRARPGRGGGPAAEVVERYQQ